MQLLFFQTWVGVVRNSLAGSPAGRDHGFPPETEGIGSASPSAMFQSRKRKHPLITSAPALSQEGPELATIRGRIRASRVLRSHEGLLQANQRSYTPGKG